MEWILFQAATEEASSFMSKQPGNRSDQRSERL